MTVGKLINQPFPYEPGIGNRLRLAAFFGCFILLFILVFKPFELDQYSLVRLLTIAASYGSITFFCVLIVTVTFPLLFPSHFNESSWTVGKQILLTATVIFLVGLINYLVSPLLVDTTLSLEDAIWFQGITLAIGLFPVTVYILSKQNRLLKKYSNQAEQIETRLQENINSAEPVIQSPGENVSRKVTFTGDYQNEELTIFLDDLYFLTTASNYLKIFHLKNDKLVYSIIRSTLKKAEEIILPHSSFMKCHRAYIINLDKVTHVEGNAQGYKIRLSQYEELIPVSRNMNSEFSDKLLSFRNVHHVKNLN